jgi:Holliday junction resolvase
MKTPEGRVKDLIKIWLKEQGAYVFSPVQTGMGSRTLDLLVCWRGMFIAIEVKKPGAKPTKLQYKIISDILTARGYAFSADSLAVVKRHLYCLSLVNTA